MVYNHPRHNPAPCEETTIDSQIAEEAAILTGIGMGTAFGLLIALMVVILLMRALSTRILARIAERAAMETADARDRALAGVVAVSALLADPKRKRAGDAPR